MAASTRRLGALVLALLAWSVPTSAQVLTTGSLTAAGDVVTIPLSGVAVATVQLSGTWAGQVEFQATADGDNWWPLHVAMQADGSSAQRVTTTGFVYVVNAGYTAMRARATVVDSGTVTVTATRGVLALSVTSKAAASPPVALPVPPCNPVTLRTKAQGKCF